MSILKYFKLIPKASDTLFKELPDPNEAVSKTMANDEVLKVGYGDCIQSNCVYVNHKNRHTHTVSHELWIHNNVYRITVNTVIFLITCVYIC